MWWTAIPVGYAAVALFAWAICRSGKKPMPRPEGDRRA